jgi:hypothetical protein
MDQKNSLIERIEQMKSEVRKMVLEVNEDYNVQIRNIDFSWRRIPEKNRWSLKVNVKVGI